MMNTQTFHEPDGWATHDDIEVLGDSQQQDFVKFKGQKALSILQDKNHSLQPDMVSGWRPKLPSCPLPLSYKNQYIESLLTHMVNEDRFSVTYIGPRYMNSVQINQRYEYYWRYRDRYSLNLAIIQEAVKNIGDLTSSKIQVKQSPHKFDSAFESGNLDLAIRVKKNQYDCFIRSDTNTKGHTNWYYFKVSNKNNIGPVKFNICNMSKTRNLYSKGMKPYVKVCSDDGQTERQWSQKQCSDVIFVERLCRYGFDKKTNQLQFTYNFKQQNQTVYFAYGLPYTYTDLQNFVKEIKQNYGSLVKTRKLCQSLGGIELPLLTITNPDPLNNGSQNVPENQINYTKKKAVVITARIHPGQSNSSHVLQGFIRNLLKDTQESNSLRSLFVFYIVPMLNPDGVIAGNFRTSYSGKDLNRKFNALNKYLFPQITYLCDFCHNLKKSYHRTIDFYFDFHGHSAKKNLFCYGPEHQNTKIYFFKARALAKILERISPIFSYRKSIFTISQHKRNTGRAYMLKNLKIPMTYTFQISNGLYQNQKKTDVYLNRKYLIEAGKIVLDGLYRYSRLEMRMPSKNVKAKIDTNKSLKRPLNSAGNYRKRQNSELFKKKSSQQITQLRLPKGKSVNKSVSIDKVKNQENKEFIALIKQIKNEEEHIEIEGGSDSQGSEDDLSQDQSNNLFKQIMQRNKLTSYNFKKVKKSKQTKILSRKQSDQDHEPEQQQTKKYRSSRLIQMSKPPVLSSKNIKRGLSYQYDKIPIAQKNFTLLL